MEKLKKRGRLGGRSSDATANASAVTDRPEQPGDDLTETSRFPYETQAVAELCVRYNNLNYCMENIEKMSVELALALDRDPEDRENLPLAGSAAVLDSCAGQLCTYIGAKIVYYDLAEHFIDAVYVPTPESTRIDVALEQLDEILGDLFEMLPGDHAFKEVLHGLFCAFVNVMHRLLKKGGGERRYVNDDVIYFIEDLETVENWFQAKDEDGVVQGLDVETVEEATLPLHSLVEELRFSASESAKKR